jgi:hypothetical protein
MVDALCILFTKTFLGEHRHMAGNGFILLWSQTMRHKNPAMSYNYPRIAPAVLSIQQHLSEAAAGGEK